MSTTSTRLAWTTGSALETSYALARDNFVVFFPAVLILTAPSVIVDVVDFGWPIGWGLAFICYSLVQIALAWGALRAMSGYRPDLLSVLRRFGRPAAGSLLTLCVVQYAAMIATLILVVPACFLLAIWAVAVPVMLVEGTDMRGAFRRSAELTRERRWRVFGVYVLWFLIFGLGFGIVFLLIMKALGAGDQSLLYEIAAWLLASLTATILYTLPAVLYVLLRQEKEGTTIAQIAITRD